ncbi:hypothetical protein [Rhodopseudomonas sp. P2A-2r]|uniref:hypothetical protein n=1 Tax=unclassified Rhodopseudomonas TaxID=2638247 RepID=UPI002234D9A2|nr:hypothetical protein [Rhodopseudomonas sp. P2A-2r]UZE50946.1 hypothetical protein ONR75_10150 [Rhodopseudomonas sp. P2A-2r]
MALFRGPSASRRSRFARIYALLASIGLLSVPASSPVAQGLDYRSPDTAPPAWGQFAKLVKYRFEEWISADDAVANRFRAWLKETNGKQDGPPTSLVVKAWLNPDGSVERVSFAAFKDERANTDLRAVLTRGNIGEAPPPEMLQPINLRFSLNIAN